MPCRSSCPAGDASECYRQVDCEDCVKAREETAPEAFWRIVHKKRPDDAVGWMIGGTAEEVREWAVEEGYIEASEEVSIIRTDMIGVLDTALECTVWGDENLSDILEFVKEAIERLRDVAHKAEHDPLIDPGDLLNAVKQFLAGS
ncbi:MAG: hypothetical protein VB144_11755 [Clostridia bacterium]|nr:hypothetical protein [Clostridia bacterium]